MSDYMTTTSPLPYADATIPTLSKPPYVTKLPLEHGWFEWVSMADTPKQAYDALRSAGLRLPSEVDDKELNDAWNNDAVYPNGVTIRMIAKNADEVFLRQMSWQRDTFTYKPE